ncbi:MAG TPA: gamma-glutamylcyclotransferase family protein [Longimicrobiaceae bacterium]|nr:gamma-glutamylcyclotransferase family protein [Longimicrobiaceae bacterium]
MERLFVYGTLRRGGGMHSLLDGCRLHAEATVRGSLFDLGTYPALVLDDRGTVHGEVWECPRETLLRLDSYEGVGEGLFRRVRIEVGSVPCWTYIAGPRLRSRIASAPTLDRGRWPLPPPPNAP